jgi:acetyltransferase-like isoleucine patch superfamily enzyme
LEVSDKYMNMITIIKKMRPLSVRRFLPKKLNQAINTIKAPRMVWGYKDSNGEWRPRTRISDTVFMYHPERIRIADNVFIWHYSILDGTGAIEIGEGTQIGAWVGIFTHSSHIAIRIYGNHYQEIPEQSKKGYPINRVKVGKYVFIGAGAKIMPGAVKGTITIGDGSIVTPGSIVNKDVGDFQIVSGNPCEVIGDTGDIDKIYLRDPDLLRNYQEWQKK